MIKNFLRRRKILKEANFLELTPVRKYQHKEEENGNISIIVPKFKSKKISNFMLSGKRQQYYRIKLDQPGSSTWLEIDGKQNVNDICLNLVHKLLGHNETRDEIERRVTLFLTKLYEERFITFKEIENNHKPENFTFSDL